MAPGGSSIRARRTTGRLARLACAVVFSSAWPVSVRAQAAQRVPALARDSAHASADSVAAARARLTPVVGEAKLLGRGVAHVLTSPLRWDREDWLRLPIATGGLLVLSALDDDARNLMRRNQTEDLDELTLDVQRLGTVYNFRILLGFYAAGLVFDDGKARAVAAEGLASSLVAAGIITPALQYIVGRSRPRASDDPYELKAFSHNISFPSGHTTHAFAVASVIATEYDALWVKATAYGLASAVGVSRMYHDAHHLSDVTAAALIGTLVGRSVVHFGQRYRGSLSVRPAVSSTGTGLAVSLRF